MYLQKMLTNPYTEKEIEIFKNAKIIILTPSNKNLFHDAVQCVIDMVAYSWNFGLKVETIAFTKHGLVDNTRNVLARTALDATSNYDDKKIAKLCSEIGQVAYECNSFTTLYISPERSANDWLKHASETGPISTIPDIIGVTVHYNNHMGVYIGSGEVVEARGTFYGVVQTKLADRGWTSWAKYAELEYDQIKKEDSMQKGDKGEAVYDYQWACKTLGVNMGTWLDLKLKTPTGCDGLYGNDMIRVTKEIQTRYKLAITGVADIDTLGVVMNGLRDAINSANVSLKSSNDILNIARQQRNIINGYIKSLMQYANQNP